MLEYTGAWLHDESLLTEVAVEVTNDGENYSGGEGLNGTFILSTAKIMIH